MDKYAKFRNNKKAKSWRLLTLTPPFFMLRKVSASIRNGVTKLVSENDDSSDIKDKNHNLHIWGGY